MDYPTFGFKIEFDKTPIKWSGSVKLKSSYKSLYHYISSSKESYEDAMQEIVK